MADNFDMNNIKELVKRKKETIKLIAREPARKSISTYAYY